MLVNSEQEQGMKNLPPRFLTIYRLFSNAQTIYVAFFLSVNQIRCIWVLLVNVRESEGRLDTDCLPGSQVIMAWKIVYKAILIFFLLETCNKSCFIYYRGNSASQSLTFLNKIPPLGLKEN